MRGGPIIRLAAPLSSAAQGRAEGRPYNIYNMTPVGALLAAPLNVDLPRLPTPPPTSARYRATLAADTAP